MTHPVVPRRRRTGVLIADLVVATVLWGLLVLAGGLAMFFAVMYFSASVPGCVARNPCAAREQAENAVVVLSAGVLGGWTVAGVGSAACAVVRRSVWYWPLLGILIASAGTWWGFREVIAAGGFR
ncbi:hypothetical protein [Tsukamurella sp. NPDC003166]|uniref:hypothetical protein n=1 Tax=Tsukamurella sp. NPDC003166 TaxID=3154444 RepID=UPI0033ACCB99